MEYSSGGCFGCILSHPPEKNIVSRDIVMKRVSLLYVKTEKNLIVGMGDGSKWNVIKMARRKYLGFADGC